MKPLFSLIVALLASGALPVLAQPPDPFEFVPGGALIANYCLTQRCYGMAAAPVGPFIYVFGGSLPPGPTGLIERIDTRDNSVRVLNAQITARNLLGAVAVGDSIYIFGGTTKSDPSGASSFVERFDVRTAKVVRLAPAPEDMTVVSPVVVGNKIYLARQGQSDLLIYEPGTAKWSHSAPSQVTGTLKLVARDGTVYAFSDFGDTSCQAYDVATNVWHNLTSMPMVSNGYELALSGDSVFFFGEYRDLTRVLRYDLKTGEWHRLVGTGFGGRRLPAACASNGKIYVMGGKMQQIGTYMSSVQVFDANKLCACDFPSLNPK